MLYEVGKIWFQIRHYAGDEIDLSPCSHMLPVASGHFDQAAKKKAPNDGFFFGFIRIEFQRAKNDRKIYAANVLYFHIYSRDIYRVALNLFENKRYLYLLKIFSTKNRELKQILVFRR